VGDWPTIIPTIIPAAHAPVRAAMCAFRDWCDSPRLSSGILRVTQGGPDPMPHGAPHIILADLAYLAPSEYVHPLPLNVAGIAAHLLARQSDLAVTLVKDPRHLLRLLDDASPTTILALSNYDWNKSLNTHVLRLARERQPRIVTVLGGPNIQADSEVHLRSLSRAVPELDFYVTGEGEGRFARLVAALREHDFAIERTQDALPPSIIAFDRAHREPLRGAGAEEPPCDCARLPSPYLTGLLDSFLSDEHLVPIIETNRGCPYSCAFCCWGNATDSSLRAFAMERVEAEIEYIARHTRSANRCLYIADGNFGILRRDVEIARAIRHTHAEHGYPHSIYVYFAKNTDDKVLAVAELLRGLTSVSMSKQSYNEDVLEIIGRRNISHERYTELRGRLEAIGMSPYCELIYGLPGESLDSFLDGFEAASRAGMQVTMYPLLLIRGTRIDTDAFRQQYGIQSRWRVIPRYVGSFGSIHSAEYEEVVVAHDCFSQRDFETIRLIEMLYFVVREAVFAELRQALHERGQHVAALVRSIVAGRDGWPDWFEQLVGEFEQETRAQLLTREQVPHVLTAEDVDSLRRQSKVINYLYYCRMIATPESRGRLRALIEGLTKAFLAACGASQTSTPLSAVLDACFDKLPGFPEPRVEIPRSYDYDFDAWLAAAPGTPLASHRVTGRRACRLCYPADYARRYAEHLRDLGDPALALYTFRVGFVAESYRASTCTRELLEVARCQIEADATSSA
jgi:radical SAM superfamily enzyme YgiQ (UPF0313 family)